MKHVKWTHEEHVAVIQLMNPPANALSSQVLQELDAVFNEVEENEEIRVVLLHGEGRFFSAGADIKEFTETEPGEDFVRLAQQGQKLFERIETFSKPVIAAIHGAALGGGLELALACHLRLVTEDAKLGLPELSLGLIPGFGGTQRLLRYVGTARAAEMMMTSKPITGLEAVQFGLANHAYKDEELLENAKTMANEIAKKSPITLKAVIKLLNCAKTEEFAQGVKKEAKLFGKVSQTMDSKEGISAFLEKREPSFSGK